MSNWGVGAKSTKTAIFLPKPMKRHLQWTSEYRTSLVLGQVWSVPFPDIWSPHGHSITSTFELVRLCLDHSYRFFDRIRNGQFAGRIPEFRKQPNVISFMFGLLAQICVRILKFCAFGFRNYFIFGHLVFGGSLHNKIKNANQISSVGWAGKRPIVKSCVLSKDCWFESALGGFVDMWSNQ